MRRLSIVVVLSSWLGACDREPEVRAFEVHPKLACATQKVDVTWNVFGAARLSIVEGTANPTPEQIEAHQADIPSKGTQAFPVAETTAFVVGVVIEDDGNRRVQWAEAKSVDVASATDQVKVETRCDPQTLVCSGTVSLHPLQTQHALKLSAPTLTRAGQTTPASVCVTHGAFKACVAPETSIESSVTLDGAWTLETTLPQGSSPAPPPTLAVAAQLKCGG